MAGDRVGTGSNGRGRSGGLLGDCRGLGLAWPGLVP